MKEPKDRFKNATIFILTGAFFVMLFINKQGRNEVDEVRAGAERKIDSLISEITAQDGIIHSLNKTVVKKDSALRSRILSEESNIIIRHETTISHIISLSADSTVRRFNVWTDTIR